MRTIASKQFSISFTVGKGRAAHGGNPSHNNRTFLADNIQEDKTVQNISYKMQPIEAAYQQLFGEAIAEYNEKQTRPCRRITDYLAQITDGKREQPFYEAVVQFGDCKTVPHGSEEWRIASMMLNQYMLNFQQRNPNLYVFNAVLHLDEASPHLHIDFIPFYTKQRQRGLKKGVSMRAALIEQGFVPKAGKNQMELWAQSERDELETVLHRHGFERENKHANYSHMEISEYKALQDARRMAERLRRIRTVLPNHQTVTEIQKLRTDLSGAQKTIQKLTAERNSPYYSFYYSSDDKQSYVQNALEQRNIPYRETENGLEAQACYVKIIREIEKSYQSPAVSHREKMRGDIDRMLMQSASFEELLTRMETAGYKIKQGKYIAARPQNGERFIRLKSLGAEYSEGALKNRLKGKQQYEQRINELVEKVKRHPSPNCETILMMKQYIVVFKAGRLPMRKRKPGKPFSWTNDAELERLLEFNRMINQGETLDTLRRSLEKLESQETKAAEEAAAAERMLKAYYQLKDSIGMIYEGKQSADLTMEQAKHILREFPFVNQSNYFRIEALIADSEQQVRETAKAHQEIQAEMKHKAELLSTGEKIFGGTYVQNLAETEWKKRESDFLPGGFRSANPFKR